MAEQPHARWMIALALACMTVMPALASDAPEPTPDPAEQVAPVVIPTLGLDPLRILSPVPSCATCPPITQANPLRPAPKRLLVEAGPPRRLLRRLDPWLAFQVPTEVPVRSEGDPQPLQVRVDGHALLETPTAPPLPGQPRR